jgi:hypothetical protein
MGQLLQVYNKPEKRLAGKGAYDCSMDETSIQDRSLHEPLAWALMLAVVAFALVFFGTIVYAAYTVVLLGSLAQG